MNNFKRLTLIAVTMLLAACATRQAYFPEVSTSRVVSTSLVAHFINVGQGSCLIYECPKGGLLLNDCGTVSQGNGLEKDTVIEYINGLVAAHKKAIPKPLSVVVSHPDRDHYNLIYYTTENGVGIDKTAVNGVYLGQKLKEGYNSDFVTWTQGMTVTDFNRPDKKDGFLQCGDASFDVMTVNSNPTPVSNPDSLVLRANYANGSIITPGDATSVTQDKVIANYKGNFSPTILAASHHGAESNGSNDVDWAKAANPKYLVIQAGEHGTFRHPRCSIIDNYLTNSKALSVAKPHSITCGTTTGWDTRIINRAIFTNNTNGTIVAKINQDGTVELSVTSVSGAVTTGIDENSSRSGLQQQF
ncbi:MAG: ComEC/Rec2 family competence protein [Ginsengibacter sp.]